MIVWLNGAFGVGKTTAVRELQGLLPGSYVFDPEDLGDLTRRLLPQPGSGTGDYQDQPLWRRLVADTLAALRVQLGPETPLLVPMSLLRQEYRDEIFGDLAARRLAVHHLVLDAEETVLRARIENDAADPGARLWRLAHLDAYRAALPWLRLDAVVLDTTELTPRQAGERVLALLRDGAAPVPIVQDPVAVGDTVAAAVLLFDEEDRVLLVDPVYKPGWEFPGGVVETGEAPIAAAVREAAEELGLRLEERELRLLAVDWEPRTGPRSGGLRLMFDGGRVGRDAREKLRLPAAELRGWRFVGPEEWAAHLAPHKATRLRAACAARAAGRVLYLEAGQER